MTTFNRRIYHSWGQFWQDMRFPLRNRPKIRAAMRGGLVSFAFRERLMLSVTAVNGCRYCSYFHAKEAVKAGLPEAELRNLLHGIADETTPAEELPALLYAQHWAESNAQPDPEARQKLIATYGAECSEAIETVLRMIRMGNLLGNQWDYMLTQVTFGRYGLTQAERTGQP